MNNKKFENYLNSLEISEIYDLYQLNDEFTQQALEMMEKIALERDGYQLKKEEKNSNKIIGIIAIVMLIFFTEFIKQIFKSLGLFFSTLIYSTGIAVYFILQCLENNRLSNYDKKIKKLREKKGMSEIIVAIADKDLIKFNELFEFGRNIHKKTKGDWTALMYAARQNEIEIAKILLANGSNPNEKNNDGESAKTLAAENKFIQMSMLLENH